MPGQVHLRVGLSKVIPGRARRSVRAAGGEERAEWLDSRLRTQNLRRISGRARKSSDKTGQDQTKPDKTGQEVAASGSHVDH